MFSWTGERQSQFGVAAAASSGSGGAAAASRLCWRRGGGVAGGFEISGQCRLGAHADSTLVHATWGSYTGCGAALSMRCWRATLRKAGRARLSSMVLFFFWLRRAWPELSCIFSARTLLSDAGPKCRDVCASRVRVLAARSAAIKSSLCARPRWTSRPHSAAHRPPTEACVRLLEQWRQCLRCTEGKRRLQNSKLRRDAPTPAPAMNSAPQALAPQGSRDPFTPSQNTSHCGASG